MRSIALVALFFVALGTGCASQRTKTTYVARAPSFAPSATYRNTSYAVRRPASRVVRSTAPVYGTSYARRSSYASRVPPPPPPPPLYAARPAVPARTVAYTARTPAPRRAVTPARRPAPPSYPAPPRPAAAHKSCVSFVGGFAGILPPSSCST